MTEFRTVNFLHQGALIRVPSTMRSSGCTITRWPASSPSSTCAAVAERRPIFTGVRRALPPSSRYTAQPSPVRSTP